MGAENPKDTAKATSKNSFDEEVPVTDDDPSEQLEAAKAWANRLQRKNSFLQENFYTNKS